MTKTNSLRSVAMCAPRSTTSKSGLAKGRRLIAAPGLFAPPLWRALNSRSVVRGWEEKKTMGNSPFTASGTHPDGFALADDTDADIRITRRKLQFVIARLQDAAQIVRSNPKLVGVRKAFTPDDVAALCGVITRLESCAQQLINAGF